MQGGFCGGANATLPGGLDLARDGIPPGANSTAAMGNGRFTSICDISSNVADAQIAVTLGWQGGPVE